MFDRNSDYALNKKDPDAIVCKSSTGVHIRLTRLDFSSQEEFEKWKQWSDQDYHHTEKKDHVYANHTIPTDKLVEVSITVVSPEEELMEAYDRQERERLYLQLKDGLELCLTSAQRRRLYELMEHTLPLHHVTLHSIKDNLPQQKPDGKMAAIYEALHTSFFKERKGGRK